MCEKCVRKGKRAKLKRGKINFFAHHMINRKNSCIPLFEDAASNFAINGKFWKLRRRRTFRKKEPPEE